MADELEKWLRKEAAERTAAANSRRAYARDGVNSTDKDRKAAHALTEKMLGRKNPKTTRAEEAKSAAIQERIAAKLDQEAATLLGFADFVARELSILIPKQSFKLPSHAWCPQCYRIEPLEWEGINLSSVNQDFDGGDVACKTCHYVIATLYVPWVTPEEPKCGDCMVVHGKSVCTMNCGPAVGVK